ncbi:hypothetical protein [Ralstonia pseudosolanacearum]|uniref:hypothetical protein n=1 Tax=Ralstonia pseudosolanacearum TaxID=1310165 RepID=UPI0018D0B2F3|nr:hypothetical protein [Ralstonia pseudosolanacearum]UWD92214.1 hypothetical protein NY025_14700 [Ralstonia pseudosolanacearum]
MQQVEIVGLRMADRRIETAFAHAGAQHIPHADELLLHAMTSSPAPSPIWPATNRSKAVHVSEAIQHGHGVQAD